ncbi:hypothetical protein [Roseateles sp. LKC17W]|uniref:VOC family protein n=1 Tax=Pelomonas margarita TaxID=3299031 RepID=A0ABW7FJN6_9BURK
MNPLRSATVVVADAEAAAARYVDHLDHRLIERGVVPAALAQRWGAPASAGRRYTVVRPASGRAVDLRFVEGHPMPGLRPLRTFGWAALELCVQDVHAVHARLRGGPFDIVGPPTANPGLPSIHPMQVCGPDGEFVYLTQILQGGPGSGLPDARSPVDVLFIAVLACADLDASARWCADVLGLRLQAPLDIPYRMLNRAFELPELQRHRIVCAEHAGELCVELDQYPAGAVPRPVHDGQLPPGVALVTLTHPDLSAIPGDWLAPPQPLGGAIYEGRRVGVLRSPEGALFEVMEEAR